MDFYLTGEPAKVGHFVAWGAGTNTQVGEVLRIERGKVYCKMLTSGASHRPVGDVVRIARPEPRWFIDRLVRYASVLDADVYIHLQNALVVDIDDEWRALLVEQHTGRSGYALQPLLSLDFQN